MLSGGARKSTVEEMVQHGDGIQVFRHELRRKEKRKVFDGSADKGSKSVESIHFPGFYSQEMLELPGQYEAPILMNAITQRQHFNTGFMKFWKRIYLSEASVAIMQDMFWWIFLDKFEGKSVSSRPASDEEEPLKRMGEMDTKEAKDKLFNRISDSFVNLFFSINPDMKDKFLNVYPNCLAQTIFACYTECFPISKILFDHSFKQFVAHICYEWISGVKPNPNVLSSWKTEKLMSTVAPEQTTSESKTTSKGIDVNQCFDAFKKRTESSKLSGEGDAANAGVNMSRQLLNTARMDKTSMAAVGSDEMERLPFSIYGRSPLVAHWLRSKHLAGKSQHKTGPQSMVRMQIDHINEETLTFADIIREVKENAVRRRKEVYRIENETQKEIRRIDENLKLQLRNLNKFQDKMSREM